MFILILFLCCGQILGAFTVKRSGRIENQVELQIDAVYDFADFNQFQYEGVTFLYKIANPRYTSPLVPSAVFRAYNYLKTEILLFINQEIRAAITKKYGRVQNLDALVEVIGQKLFDVFNQYAHGYAILVLAHVLQDLGRSIDQQDDTFRKALYDKVRETIDELKVREVPKQSDSQYVQNASSNISNDIAGQLSTQYARLAKDIQTKYKKMLQIENTPFIVSL